MLNLREAEVCTTSLQYSGAPVFLRNVAVNHCIPQCARLNQNMSSLAFQVNLKCKWGSERL